MRDTLYAFSLRLITILLFFVSNQISLLRYFHLFLLFLSFFFILLHILAAFFDIPMNKTKNFLNRRLSPHCVMVLKYYQLFESGAKRSTDLLSVLIIDNGVFFTIHK